MTPTPRASGPRNAGPWLLVLCTAFGIAAGLGLFTFRYAEGLSYFSSAPTACVNCHIMRSQYDSWQKSSHHQVAVCIDCHLPHAFVEKYLAKAENGYRHSKEFTAQTFHEPIRVQPRGLAILQQNCVDCHAALTDQMRHASSPERGALECIHCHAGVGHGERSGLGGPLKHSLAPSPLRSRTEPRASTTPSNSRERP